MATNIEIIESVSARDYPYVVVEGVRIGPPIAVGMHTRLAYVDMTVDEAISFVSKFHTNVQITNVINFVEA